MAWKDLQADILEDIAGLQYDELEAQEVQYSRVREREREQERAYYKKLAFELKLARTAIREGVLDQLPEERRLRLTLVAERYAKTLERQRRNQRKYRESLTPEEKRARNAVSGRCAKKRRATETPEARERRLAARKERKRKALAARIEARSAARKPSQKSREQKKAFKSKARKAASAFVRGDLHLVPRGFAIPAWAIQEVRALKAQRARDRHVVDGTLERTRDADSA